ncbi:peptidoglycan editing factor PgeF [Prevotella sp. E13-27]|uniref:peptidoglycan editing factor PgeF n=1 Tax=Prevotella sp. E13-27 TaxID=2938122 RepID=UPI00200AF345|nr:peptidoglycan editing factor PgeF [Prevotella sp. E13-27]MCK8620968.1 peptidoglycan editing factor PgeF [Prevotella sp. E13-27]
MRIPQLKYYDLGEHVTAFSTTRHGGCSAGNYGELNINPYCGDDPAAVAKNRELLAQELPIPSVSSILLPHQVHGKSIIDIDEDFLEKRFTAQDFDGFDGIITNQAGVCIGVSTADCIPVILYDAVHHCAAAIHAGWRGTVQRIVQEAALHIHSRYHTDYGQLLAVIGPGISLKNFEVGQEVYDRFEEEHFPMDKIADTTSWPKPHIDLKTCNRLQLTDLGVPDQNIFDCGICTFDETDRFFSARRLGINSGRIYTGIVIHS